MRPDVINPGGQTRHRHLPMIAPHRSNWLRLRTLANLRWAAVAGQLVALAIADRILGLDLPFGACLTLVALSAAVNLAIVLVFPANTRLTEQQATLTFLFDTVQLMALVALTGGLANPFALLVLAPVAISSSSLPRWPTVMIAAAAIGLTSLAALWHLPLRAADGTVLRLPPLFVTGFWVAIVIGVSFVAAYARRVSLEVHTMSEALLATQMALMREQKLTDLGGVVAAAAHELGTPLATIKLASSEMIDELAGRPDLAADARLIRDQADRCRDILRSMGQAGKRDTFIATAAVTDVLREAAEPHLDRGKAIRFGAGPDGPLPVIRRQPEVIHGLRNLVQNAVDFAETTVVIDVETGVFGLRIRIADDGPGYPPYLMNRLGDPFLQGRDPEDGASRAYEGMGLGLFIAKTLLARTDAEIEFLNGEAGGALVLVTWPAGAEVLVSEPIGPNTPIL